MLKGISGNKHISDFVLRDRLLRPIVDIDRPPIDVQRQFIDKYNKYRATYPCISRSASGESTESIVVVYSSLVVVYSSLVCLQ